MAEEGITEEFSVFEFNAEDKEKLKEKAEKIKSKHKVKSVYYISVKGEDGDEKEEYVGWLKRPDLKVMSAFTSSVQKDLVMAIKMVVNSCWLEGDSEIKDDDDVFLGAMSQVQEIMTVRQSRIVKL